MLWCAIIVLTTSLAGCSQNTCIDQRVVAWNGQLVDGGGATSPDAETCSRLCDWTVACTVADAGVFCPAYCVP